MGLTVYSTYSPIKQNEANGLPKCLNLGFELTKQSTNGSLVVGVNRHKDCDQPRKLGKTEKSVIESTLILDFYHSGTNFVDALVDGFHTSGNFALKGLNALTE